MQGPEPERASGRRIDGESARPPHWRPTASVAAMEARARLYRVLRAFFEERGILEVETPVLGSAVASDPGIRSIAVAPAPGAGEAGGEPLARHLHTSPEHAMKRLLAATGRPLYQIAKVFRGGERSPRHNPEFTLLEWYRPGCSCEELMAEVELLLRELLGLAPFRRLPWAEAMERFGGIGAPDETGDLDERLTRAAAELGLADRDRRTLDRDALLELVFGARVTPALGPGGVFVTEFPPGQASLAKVAAVPPRGESIRRGARAPGGHGMRALRFEVFVDGVELGNGYEEIDDPREYEARHAEHNRVRRLRGLPEVPLDRRLLAALAAGHPPAAGVALGVDRILMCQLGASSIDEVIAFPVEHA